MQDLSYEDFVVKNIKCPYDIKHSDIINEGLDNQLTINYYTEPNNLQFNTANTEIYHIIEIKNVNNIILYTDILKCTVDI